MEAYLFFVRKSFFIFYLFFFYFLCIGALVAVQTPWRNGSASDSKSEGWGFESLWRQNLAHTFCVQSTRSWHPLPSSSVPVAQLDKASDYESEDWGFESLQGY